LRDLASLAEFFCKNSVLSCFALTVRYELVETSIQCRRLSVCVSVCRRAAADVDASRYEGAYGARGARGLRGRALAAGTGEVNIAGKFAVEIYRASAPCRICSGK